MVVAHKMQDAMDQKKIEEFLPGPAEFLGLAIDSLDRLESSGDLSEARDIASHVLDVDSTAREIEQRLVRIYWRLGARSAALSQYEHLVSLDRADGLDPPSITEVTS